MRRFLLVEHIGSTPMQQFTILESVAWMSLTSPFQGLLVAVKANAESSTESGL